MKTLCMVGTDVARIVAEIHRLLTDDTAYRNMSRAHNPYGDGQACQRILATLSRTRDTAANRPPDLSIAATTAPL